MTRFIYSCLFAVLVLLTPSLARGQADDTHQCLNELSGPLNVYTGEQPIAEYQFWGLPNGARFDARGATFFAQTDPEPTTGIIAYPVSLRSDFANNICWAGGIIHYTNDLNITWSDSKHPNNAALVARTGNVTIDGIRIYNAHDSIRPSRNTDMFFNIRNSWVTYSRDDCVENDYYAGGLIDDSLFDGCSAFLSSRIPGGISNNNTVTVQNSLIHLQEMPGPYGHPDPEIMGHGNLFKFDPDSPDLRLFNNIIMIDDYANTKSNSDGSAASSFEKLGLQPDKLTECSGNIIVWLGPGSFPGDLTGLGPECVTVTDDRTIYDDAKAQWLANHPLVDRIPGVDDATPPPPAAIAVTTLQLLDSETDTVIDADVTNGETYDISGDLTVKWRALVSGAVESVTFEEDGVQTVIENNAPYEDGLVNFSGGTHTITATPFPLDGASGPPGTPLSVVVTIFKVAPTNASPTASFTYSCTDLNCIFTDASTDSDGTIASWLWDFGDGNTSTERNPFYAFASANTYTVTLTVTDDDGDTGNTSTGVTVTDPVAPHAIERIQLYDVETGTIIDPDVTTGETYSIFSGSDDPTVGFEAVVSGPVDSVKFETNARTVVIENNFPYSSNLLAFDDGQNVIVLTPFDGPNATGTAGPTFSVTVTVYQTDPTPPNELPVAGFTWACTNLDCAFADTSTDSDGTVASYAWDFGDGNTSTSQNPAHSFAAAGSHTVTLTVTDDIGDQDVEAWIVTVLAPDPGPATVDIIGSGIVVADQEQTIVANVDGDLPVEFVDFFVNGSRIGTVEAAPWQLSWTPADSSTRYTITIVIAYEDGSSTGYSVDIRASDSVVSNPDPNDVTPPSVAITGPTGILVKDSPETITVDAADANGIWRIEISVNGVLLAADETAPYSAAWIPTSSTEQYTLRAAAVDLAGNVSVALLGIRAADSPVSNPDPTDVTPPLVSITQPSGIVEVDVAQTIIADASDANGIWRIEFYANGDLLGTPDTTAPYSQSWTPTDSGLEYSLHARAIDLAGLVSRDIVRVRAADSVPTNPDPTDTTPPTVSITGPPKSVRVDVEQTITVVVSDANAVWRVEVTVDGDQVAILTGSPWQATWIPTIAHRHYTITAKAVDVAGNIARARRKVRARP